MARLNRDFVALVFKHCFFKIHEKDESLKIYIGGGFAFGAHFHSARIEEQREVILALVAELPEHFRSQGGRLEEAFVDRHGEEWVCTGEFWEKQDDVTELLCLAAAIGQVAECNPPIDESWRDYPISFRLVG